MRFPEINSKHDGSINLIIAQCRLAHVHVIALIWTPHRFDLLFLQLYTSNRSSAFIPPEPSLAHSPQLEQVLTRQWWIDKFISSSLSALSCPAMRKTRLWFVLPSSCQNKSIVSSHRAYPPLFSVCDALLHLDPSSFSPCDSSPDAVRKFFVKSNLQSLLFFPFELVR